MGSNLFVCLKHVCEVIENEKILYVGRSVFCLTRSQYSAIVLGIVSDQPAKASSAARRFLQKLALMEVQSFVTSHDFSVWKCNHHYTLLFD